MRQIGIITGGASGIGLALGAALVRRGWHVVLADIDEAKARDAAGRLSDRGPGSATATGVDVRDAAAVADLVTATHAEHGRLDLMVNNAGVVVLGEPDDLLLAHWDRVLDVNLRGVIHGCHAAYPLMKAQGSGTILNTSSLMGLFPQTGDNAILGTTKSAIVALSLALRAAGAEYGVHVSVLCPGVVDTPMLDSVCPDDLPIPASAQRGLTLRQMAIKSGWPAYSPDELAEETLTGLAKNKPILIIPGRFRRLWLLARLLPGTTIRMTEKTTTSERQDRAQRATAPTTDTEPSTRAAAPT